MKKSDESLIDDFNSVHVTKKYTEEKIYLNLFETKKICISFIAYENFSLQ